MAVAVNERLADEVVHHAIDLDGYSNGVVRRLLAILNRADARLFAQLQEVLDGMDAGSFTVQRLEGLLQSVRALNADVYRQFESAVLADMLGLSGTEATYHGELMRSALPPQISVVSITQEQVYAAALSRPMQGRLLREWAASLEADRAARIRDTLRMGYLEGKTTDQLVREIRGTRAKGYSDGIIEIDRRHAESVVRTAVSHTAATARDQFQRANLDLIKAVVWRSTLDGRTSPPCRLRDGKAYTPDTHRPIDHEYPWGAGPGRFHWNAVPAGTLVYTRSGDVPIECVTVGTMVLTHLGRWRAVSQLLSKQCEGGVVRVAHTQSGRRLRATYDHPILTRSGWKFMGALEVGDDLLSDQEGLDEVGGVKGAINPEAKYDPALSDDSLVALARALQLVPANIDLERDLDVRAREIEDGSIAFVLWNPERVEGDQCTQHHLLALAHALKKLGRYRLGDLLAHVERNRCAEKAFTVPDVVSASRIGHANLFGDAWHAARVALRHALGMFRVGARRVFGLAIGPMLGARGMDEATGCDLKRDLVAARSDGEMVSLRETGEAPVSEPMLALDVSKGSPADHVLVGNEGDVVRFGVRHDAIVSLEMQNHQGLVFDLSVEEDASYFASGFAVSNCRSVSTVVTKSWKELGGADMPEFTPSQRASMDGAVPSDTTYQQWLEKQSAKRQDEILGPTRGKLLRDGGLTLDRFSTDKGKWLTLEELAQRNADAFKRAGLN